MRERGESDRGFKKNGLGKNKFFFDQSLGIGEKISPWTREIHIGREGGRGGSALANVMDKRDCLHMFTYTDTYIRTQEEETGMGRWIEAG